MNPSEYVKEQILSFIADDALDFPFAYGFAAEALREQNAPEDEILRLICDVLLRLLEQDIVVIGDMVGGVENFVPWTGSPSEVLFRHQTFPTFKCSGLRNPTTRSGSPQAVSKRS